MFERMDSGARQVVVAAQEEARLLHHGSLGAEHLLLGLVRDTRTPAARVLAGLGLDGETARAALVERVGTGTSSPAGAIPATPATTAVLDQALREALSLGHEHVSDLHVLLALVREPRGAATDVLERGGATPERVRDAVQDLLTAEGAPARPTPLGTAAAPGPPPPELRQLLRQASPLATAAQVHLLLGLVASSTEVSAWLAELGVTTDAVRDRFTEPEAD